MSKSLALDQLLDVQSLSAVGMTRTEAHRLGCCARCRKDVHLGELAEIDVAEWRISALCPTCYAWATAE